MSKLGAGTTHKTTKGYLRVTAGPCRNEYVHRIVAEAMLGRELKKDEEVHHRDGDKLNCRFLNLLILGTYDHGWVSAKQNYYMTHILEPREKREWDEFMNEYAAKQALAIAVAKGNKRPIVIEDGVLQVAWEARESV